jgi:hypothetical protein
MWSLVVGVRVVHSVSHRVVVAEKVYMQRIEPLATWGMKKINITITPW